MHCVIQQVSKTSDSSESPQLEPMGDSSVKNLRGVAYSGGKAFGKNHLNFLTTIMSGRLDARCAL